MCVLRLAFCCLFTSLLFYQVNGTSSSFSEIYSYTSQFADPVVPGNVRVDATFENISINYSISGDDNLNSSLQLNYKQQGTSSYKNGAISRRAYPDLVVDGSPLNMNFHAASALYLKPDTNYDIQLVLTDPDGGSTTTNVVVRTKAFPVATKNIIKYVRPGNGGGSGTQSDPYLGLQDAADNANPGDHFIVAAGFYQPFILTRSGTPSTLISFESSSPQCAIIDGNNTDRHVVTIGQSSGTTSYIILDGFTIQNGKWGIDAQNTQHITIKNNLFQDLDFGYYNRRENGVESDQYITNNIFRGRTGWPGSGIPKERAIDIRGNNNVVSYNTIQDFADGISTDGPPYLTSYSLDIHNNDIKNAVDDLIEVDGMVSNARIYSNRLYNGRAGVSVAPVFGGPAYIMRNEIYNLENSGFKMNRGSSGLVIVNNTVVSSGSTLSSPVGWQNTFFRNNVVFSDRYCFEEFGLVSGSVDDWDYDAFYSSRSGIVNNEWFKWDDVRYANVAALQSAGLIEQNSISVSLNNFSNITLPSSWNIEYDPAQTDMRPSSGSPVINSGFEMDNINEPFVNDSRVDRGALEFGQVAPVYGATIINSNGTSCDDGDECTVNDVIDSDCNCKGTLSDSDGDGVCDGQDICPGGNDLIDTDGDNIPDDCDDCACPELATNSDPVVTVRNVSELQAALDQAFVNNGHMTISMAAGTYNLTNNLRYIAPNMEHLSIIGATGNADDVVIKGLGWNNNAVTHIFLVGADHFTIANVTLSDVFYHPIQINSNPDDADDFLAQNVKFLDAKEQLFKASGGDGPLFTDRGRILCCHFEFTAGIAYQDYTGGIDCHRARDWRIAHNTFKGILSPNSTLSEHAIHMWRESSGTIIESNKIMDCDRGIGLGLGPDPASGHVGGLVINNFVHTSVDVGIGLESAADARVYNNTVITDNYSRSIEYRFNTTTNAHIVNNLTSKQISDRSSGSTGTLETNYLINDLSIFEDPANYDYHLTADLSGVVDAGTLLSEVPVDYDCEVRNFGQTDIGADEYDFSSNPLPIELLSFSAQNSDRDVLVKWSTLREIDADYFVVQRRHELDMGFDDVSRVEAKGIDTNKSEYQINDLLPNKAGNYLYRLKLVDKDGEFSFSQTEVVTQRFDSKYKIEVFPNPTLDEVLISGTNPEAGSFGVNVYNRIGQLVSNEFEQSEGKVKIKLQSVPTGLYIIEVLQGSSITRLKVVKG